MGQIQAQRKSNPTAHGQQTAAARATQPVGGVTIDVLVSAGASQSKVRGLHGAALKVAVRAPPEKGKANAELEELLAAFFGVARRQVAVIMGATSRKKRVRILGLDAAAARAKLMI